MRPAPILRSLAAGALLAAASGLGACAIPDAGFVASIDGAPPGPPIDSTPLEAAIVLRPSAVRFLEGESTEFGVALNLEPTEAVTVTLSPSPGVSVNPPVLIFDPSKEDVTVSKKVTVSAPDDHDTVIGMEKVDVTAPGHAPASLTVTVDDGDELDITVNVSSVLVEEGKQTSILVALTAPPPTSSLQVTATVSIQDATFINVTSARTFTQKDYNVPQEFLIAGKHDDDAFDAEHLTITLKATGADDKPVDVTVDDDDSQGLSLVVASPLVVTERDDTTFTVALRQQPSPAGAAVRFTQPAGVTVLPDEVQFTATNWNQARTIRITSLGDDDATDDDAPITISSPALGISQNLALRVDDIDVQRITEDAVDPFSFPENTNRAFKARLAFNPEGPVTVTVRSTAFAVAPTNLRFTAANWSVGQDVTIQGGDATDSTMADRTGTVVLEGAGVSTTVNVVVTNTDVQRILTSVPTITGFVEDNTARNAFTARLEFSPVGRTEVAVTSNNSGAVAVVTSSLVYMPNDHGPRDVQLRAPTDSTDDDEMATIKLATAGDAQVATVDVTTSDPTVAVTYGFPTFLSGGTASASAGRLNAYPFDVGASPVLINAAQLIATAVPADGQAAIAIYTNNDATNMPDRLVLRSGVSGITMRTFPTFTTAAVADVELAANRRYWMAVVFDRPGISLGRGTTAPADSIRRCKGDVAFGSFPDMFPLLNTSPCDDTPKINFALFGFQ